MSELPSCLMTEAETAALVDLALGKRVLEMGCWTGRTTVALAEVAAVVWTVDSHRGDCENGPADTLKQYFWVLEQAGFRDRVVSVVGRFEDALPWLLPKAFDVVLVDGRHDAVSVRRDVRLAARAVVEGGAMALHDWGRYEVAEVAQPLLGRPRRLVGTLAVFDPFV